MLHHGRWCENRLETRYNNELLVILLVSRMTDHVWGRCSINDGAIGRRDEHTLSAPQRPYLYFGQRITYRLECALRKSFFSNSRGSHSRSKCPSLTPIPRPRTLRLITSCTLRPASHHGAQTAATPFLLSRTYSDLTLLLRLTLSVWDHSRSGGAPRRTSIGVRRTTFKESRQS